MLPSITADKLYHHNLQDLLSEISEYRASSEEGNAIIKELCSALENNIVATNSELIIQKKHNDLLTDIINQNITDDDERKSLHILLDKVQDSITENISFGKRISDGFKRMLLNSDETSIVGSMRSGFMESLPPGMRSLIGGLGNKLFNDTPRENLKTRLREDIRTQLIAKKEETSNTLQKTSNYEEQKQTSFVPVSDYKEIITNTFIDSLKSKYDLLSTDDEKQEFIEALRDKEGIVAGVKEVLEEYSLNDAQMEDADFIIDSVIERIDSGSIENYREKENLEVYQRETTSSFHNMEQQQEETNKTLKDIKSLLSPNTETSVDSLFGC